MNGRAAEHGAQRAVGRGRNRPKRRHHVGRLALKRDLRRASGATILARIGASEGGPFAISVTAPGQEPPETAGFMATPATVVFDDQTLEPIPWGSGRTGARGGLRPGTRQLLPPARGHGEGVPGHLRSSLPRTWPLMHLRRRRAGAPGQAVAPVCINTGGEKVYPHEVEVVGRVVTLASSTASPWACPTSQASAVVWVASRHPSSSATAEDVIGPREGAAGQPRRPARGVLRRLVLRSPSGKVDYRWAR